MCLKTNSIFLDLQNRTGFFTNVHEFGRSIFLHNWLLNVRNVES